MLNTTVAWTEQVGNTWKVQIAENNRKAIAALHAAKRVLKEHKSTGLSREDAHALAQETCCQYGNMASG